MMWMLLFVGRVVAQGMEVYSISYNGCVNAREAITLRHLTDSPYFPQLGPWQPICPLGTSVKCHWPLGIGGTQARMIHTARCIAARYMQMHTQKQARSPDLRDPQTDTVVNSKHQHKVTLSSDTSLLMCILAAKPIHTRVLRDHRHTSFSKNQTTVGFFFWPRITWALM